ncbi:hypothetical protein [Oricola indica]|jgi:phage anti-repressor protein|uniref:hypothetical protein n=1 Tax=Oricola indica TaxID=2872591 RepID=UPI001CBCF07F|nr:hypothetical protein [Oricola indica]
MALSNAEKQRRYRERQRLKKEARSARPSEDDLKPFLKTPFSEFLKERSSNTMFHENLHWVGVEVEGDLESDHPSFEMAAEWPEWAGVDPNSLNVATGMVGVFIDAAKELSTLINTYKLQEIDRAMSTASPADKVRLGYLRKQLTKRTSHFFPVIEAKED